MNKKLLFLSDSPFITTGFSNQSVSIVNGLANKYGWDAHFLAANGYVGRTLPPGQHFKDGTNLNFTIHGTDGSPYAQRILPLKIKEIQPDVFGVLLDSLPGHRPVIVRNKKFETEILAFEELYDRMMKGEEFEILAPEYRIGKKRTWTTNLKGKCYAHSTCKKEVVGIWTKIINIARRYVKDYKMCKISNKYGETEVSMEHSMVHLFNDKLEKIKPEDMFKEGRNLVKIQRLAFDRTSKRKHRGEYYADFCEFFGAYVSEGCLNKFKRKSGSTNYSIIISNNDKGWLDHIKLAGERILGCKGSFSKSGNTYNLVFYSKEKWEWIKNVAGKGSRNKRIPSIIFDLSREYQLKFLYAAIKGDGHFYKRTSKQRDYRRHKAFTYTTNSRILASGVSFLMTRLRMNHSIYYREEKDCYSLFTNSYRHHKGNTKFSTYNYEGYIYDVNTKNQMFTDGLGMIGTHNTFMLYPWFLGMDTTPAHTSFYFPSDGGGGMPLGCDQILRKVQLPVAMSKFAQKQVKDCYGLNVEYVPHALHLDKFYLKSEEERKELRRKWNLQDKWVVGIVARHQPRKQLDVTLRAFKVFAENKNDVVLLMHTDPADPAAYFDLPVQIQRMGLQNKVVFTGATYWRSWEDKDMIDVYNLMDVFFLLTSGEGFGIPTMEAMACNVPCVVTDYTTTNELLIEDGKCGEPVKILAEMTGSWNVDRGLADVFDAAAKLEGLYSSDGLRKLYGRTGRSKVESFYNWDVVLPKWNKLFEAMLE